MITNYTVTSIPELWDNMLRLASVPQPLPPADLQNYLLEHAEETDRISAADSAGSRRTRKRWDPRNGEFPTTGQNPLTGLRMGLPAWF